MYVLYRWLRSDQLNFKHDVTAHIVYISRTEDTLLSFWNDLKRKISLNNLWSTTFFHLHLSVSMFHCEEREGHLRQVASPSQS